MNIENIDVSRYAVVYQAPTSGLVKLTRLDRDRWGFVYLKRPDLKPTFVAETAKGAIKKTMSAKSPKRFRQCYVVDNATLGVIMTNGDTIDNIYKRSQPKPTDDVHHPNHKRS